MQDKITTTLLASITIIIAVTCLFYCNKADDAHKSTAGLYKIALIKQGRPNDTVQIWLPSVLLEIEDKHLYVQQGTRYYIIAENVEAYSIITKVE